MPPCYRVGYHDPMSSCLPLLLVHLAAAAPASKKRSADDALAASGLTAAVHAFASGTAIGPAVAPIASVPYAAWSADKAAAAPTSSHNRQAPRMTQYEATSWREAEKQRQDAETQRKLAELQVRQAMNTQDNLTAMELAQLEVETGERIAVSTGTGINPQP
jgi:ABC-type transport system involved in cytochrome bd biosynthesis fused ATPase/permease subunit